MRLPCGGYPSLANSHRKCVIISRAIGDDEHFNNALVRHNRASVALRQSRRVRVWHFYGWFIIYPTPEMIFSFPGLAPIIRICKHTFQVFCVPFNTSSKHMKLIYLASMLRFIKHCTVRNCVNGGPLDEYDTHSGSPIDMEHSLVA